MDTTEAPGLRPGGSQAACLPWPGKDCSGNRERIRQPPTAPWLALLLLPLVGFATDAAAQSTCPGADPVTVTVTAGPRTIDEGDTAWFTLRMAPGVKKPIHVGYEYKLVGQDRIIQSGGFALSKVGRTVLSFPFETENGLGEADGIHDYTLTLRPPGTEKLACEYTLGASSMATVRVKDNDDPPPTPVASFAAASSSASESDGTHNVTVDLSPAPQSAITLSYSVGGGATEGDDFAITGSGSVSVNANRSSVTIPVAIADDSADEGGETVILTLTNGSGYTLGSPNAHTLTITDNDNPPLATPVVSIAGGDAVTEGGSATFTLTASPAPSSSVTVNVGVTQTGSFVSSGQTGARMVTIGASGRATFTVGTMNDDTDEADGSVTATVNAGTGYMPHAADASASVAVNDDDGTTPVASFAAASSSASESDGTHNVTVDLSPAPQSAITLSYSVGGGATEGDDFAITGSGSVSVNANRSSVTIPVAIADDSADEGGETVILTLTNGSGYTLGSPNAHTLTITDNDNPPLATPVVSIAGGDAVTEGGSATFTLTASPAPSSSVTVNVGVTQTGSFVSSGQTGARMVTIGASGRATFTVGTMNDDTDEADGSVTATVNAGTGYMPHAADASASVAVNDDDGTTPVASFAAASSSASESDGTHNVTVDLSPAPQSAITLSYSVGGGATEGDDFTITGSGSISVNANRSSVTIPVAIADDSVDEGGETVILTLTNGSGYTLGSPNAHTLTITDNDNPPLATPVVSIAGGDAVTEGGSATFTLTASPAPSSSVTVNVGVTQTGSFVSSGQTGARMVTIGASGRATFTVGTMNDDTDEADGSVTATVNAGTGYMPHAADASASVAVNDDDGTTPVASFAAASSSASESDGTHNVTVDLSPAPQSAITLSYSVGGGATEGDDFAITGSGSVSVNANRSSVTIPVAIADDSADEGGETVILTLTNGSGYTLGSPNAHTLTITDNDNPPLATPVVSIAGGDAVTEGGSATFTLTASPAPSSSVTVNVGVTQTGSFVSSGQTGARMVTIGASGRATFTVGTMNDDTDEADGSVTATVNAGTGYMPHAADASASVAVNDDDGTTPVASFAAASSSASESDGTHNVTVDLSPAPQSAITLSYSVGGGATEGDDFTITGSGSISVNANRSSVTIPVAIADDSVDEGGETVILTLTNGSGYTLGAAAVHTLIIRDDDTAGIRLSRLSLRIAEEDSTAEYTVRLDSEPTEPVTIAITVSGGDEDAVGVSPDKLTFAPDDWDEPQEVTVMAGADRGSATVTHSMSSSDGKYAALPPVSLSMQFREQGPVSAAAAWLVRFARTHVGHVLEGIAKRIRAAPETGGNARLAARPVGQAGEGSLSAGVSPGGEARTVAAREALAGSSFALTGEEGAAGSVWSAWGRGAWSRFDGREGTLSLDGDAATAVLGVDRRQGRWLMGLALAHSTGKGGYNGADEGGGDLESDLTTVTPWVSLKLSERIAAWGALGYGRGDLNLTPRGGRADTETLMAAVGARGAVVEAPAVGGVGLALVSDALWLEADSDRAGEALAATSSDVSRLRMGVEGTWDREIEGAGRLGARLDLALRHDGGDAETGFGAEVGGGVSWADRARGLSLGVEGRGLMAHDASGFRDKGTSASLAWDLDPVAERGLSLGLRQDWGGPSAPGRLLAAETLAGSIGGEGARRLSAEARWGFPAFERRFTAGLRLRYGLSNAARDYSLGWRLTPEAASAPDLSFGLRATRRESDAQAAEHTVGVEIAARW